MIAAYWRYWGKASPDDLPAVARYHLLPYHCLDVAAVGHCLLRQSGGLDGESFVRKLGLSLAQFQSLFTFLLLLHDLGKFARVFQKLAPDLSPDLVSTRTAKQYSERHDTLGWLLWRDELANNFPAEHLPEPAHGYWNDWLKIVTGHHGMPPNEGGSTLLDLDDFFLDDDVDAAAAFVADAAELLLPADLQAPTAAQCDALRQSSWSLAGLAVLADWLGSNQNYFPYHDQPRLSLRDYWEQVALPAAERAVTDAGLAANDIAPFPGVDHLHEIFGYLSRPTPLQHYAATVVLADGPQLFLLEDVTGAGKTEAALILTHRLMAAGRASGFYFGLPTMATANQMYRRVGDVYARFYRPGQTPSLMLAHGARDLIDEFRMSIQPKDRGYDRGEASATLQCNGWLADNRKKALLADIGVGSLDQALLAVLPARHQSLRMLGLARKVLIVDEVHAYDSYMNRLLCRLLEGHARQGGSALLLSATVPASTRASLIAAYQKGLGVTGQDLPADERYPLATQAAAQVRTEACATREQVKRRVKIQHVHDEADVLALIHEHLAAGRCVGWIRNTVEDCRNAYLALQAELDDDALILFHSRYAMGHRLDIENRTLDTFGKHSITADRSGKVVIGSQVIEQSLDLDLDVLISDLAPIDLLIQRAGRLQRHVRDAQGNPADIEQRPAPVLYVFGPAPTETPPANWYGAVFPKAQYVYPDIGQLWLTQRALLAAGEIVSPGEPGQPGAVRQLVEAVYGDDAQIDIPDTLQEASRKCEGEALAEQSQANFNALDLGKGYCRDSNRHWDDEARIPTRLSDETQTLYLAQPDGEALKPIVEADRHGWPLSAARLGTYKIRDLSPAWQDRFGAAIAALRERYPLLEAPALVLPLLPIENEAGRWYAEALDGHGREVRLVYCAGLGVLTA
ncbi:CRISPR-associated helicase/endonuclease Cas3 [Jeongeupia sp. HS-3]|uniref:CRISPR-associated helicase Cas3' n=1 Tax=Jeongeupia sp. HS-3 TaxID=1009682 RepID=UPI0018A61254|nr:CRISPR-associated helicase Cas3' [Jeongeupia sp. HS-3]BCL75812.1 CRISPR-associated helicase/endonuclease Cas3 [Jeongeupia sp. HS-3]